MKELRVNHWPNKDIAKRFAERTEENKDRDSADRLDEKDMEKDFLLSDKAITQQEIKDFAKVLADEFNLNNPYSKIEQFHVFELFSDDAIIKRFFSEVSESDMSDDDLEVIQVVRLQTQRIRRALVEELSHLVDPSTFALVQSLLSDKIGKDGKPNKHYRLHTPAQTHYGRRLVERGGRHLAHETEEERQDMVSAHAALYEGHQDHIQQNNGRPYPYIVFEQSIPAEMDAGEHLVEEIPGLQPLDTLLRSEEKLLTFETAVRIFSETVEACEWLASKNLLLQDLKIENIGVYDGPDHKDTAILFDLEGLIDYTCESSQHSILVDDFNNPPETASFVNKETGLLPARSPAEMVYQLGLVLRDITNAYMEPAYPLSRLTQIYIEMTSQNPKERISLHEVQKQIKELTTKLKK